MTYVNRRTRFSLEEKDLRPERRRSEGRLKTYPSAEDVRAWCDVVDDRRRHILELVTRDVEKCKRTLVPPEVLDGLLGDGHLGDVRARARVPRSAPGVRDGEPCPWTGRHARELAGAHRITARADRPGKIVTKVVGLRPGFKVGPATRDGRTARSLVQGVEVDGPGTSGAVAEARAPGGTHGEAGGKYTEAPAGATGTPEEPPGNLAETAGGPPGVPGKPSIKPSDGTGRPGGAPGVPAKHSVRLAEETGAPEGPPGAPETPSRRPGETTGRPAEPPGASERPSKRPAEPTGAPGRPSGGPGEAPGAPTRPRTPTAPSPVPQAASGGEQDLLLRNLQLDNDALKEKLEDCLGQLENLQKVTTVASCRDEIDALEHEIKVMREGNLSPEEEAEVIKKEVDVLRRYCLKLKAVEDENEKLREEREELRRKVTASGAGDCLRERLDEVTRERDGLANKVRKLETELLQYKDLPEDLEVYRDRSRTLDAALAERDELRRRLDGMRGLESEAAELRRKASRLEELERAPRPKPDVEAALELKKTASRCRCLEQELRNALAEKEAMARRVECACAELERLKPLAKEAELARLERDKLQIKVNELSHLQVHNENLALKCKCLEAAAAERDAYKQRYEEMMAMECECDALRCQAEENKCLLRERDGLKRQIRDLEACIHEQDEEIKRLTCHVEAMAKSKEETQARVREALATMRAEVDKKDRLIAASEEKLATVQAQLKSSIQGVSCETLCYRTRIEELERELEHARSLARKSRRAQQAPDEEIRRELAAAREENEKLQEIAGKMVKITADEHVQKMLRQSECAVRKVVEELGKQYVEWDKMRGRKLKGAQHERRGKGCGCARGKLEAGETCDVAEGKDEEKT